MNNIKHMKNIKLKNLFLINLFSLFILSCTNNRTSDVNNSLNTLQDSIKKGEYLVKIMGCGDCHTPKKFGPNGVENMNEYYLAGFIGTDPLPKLNPVLMPEGMLALASSKLCAFEGMWGISFAANLTPDETGIGAWTKEQFIKSLKEGRYKGLDSNRLMLPPMPWQNYKENLKDEDAACIFTYLKSIKPVSNIVPQAIPPTFTNSK